MCIQCKANDVVEITNIYANVKKDMNLGNDSR
jgi:hypothetical protein